MPITIPRFCDRVIVIEDASFTVGPESFDDFSASIGFIQRNQLGGNAAGYQGAAYMIARRIKAWTGIMVEDASPEDGSTLVAPAECTERNKMALFALRPDLLDKIVSEHARQEADDRKNSKPTPSA